MPLGNLFNYTMIQTIPALNEHLSPSISTRPARHSVFQARALVAEPSTSTTGECLGQQGYQVERIHAGCEALMALEDAPFDVFVIDTDVPGMSDAELVTRARAIQPDVLIVVLAEHATVESTIAAIKANVVDYLLKPCRSDDLLTIIARAVEERAQQTRRQQLFERLRDAMGMLDATEIAPIPVSIPVSTFTPTVVPGALQVGVVSFDPEKRMATVHTQPPRTVELTDGEASVLVALMEKPNQVLTYNQLAKTALGYEGMDKWTVESVIRSTVFRLRHKIEGATDAQMIRTVRGRGYFFSPL